MCKLLRKSSAPTHAGEDESVGLGWGERGLIGRVWLRSAWCPPSGIVYALRASAVPKTEGCRYFSPGYPSHTCEAPLWGAWREVSPVAERWRYVGVPPVLQGDNLGGPGAGRADRRMEETVHEMQIPEIILSLICGDWEKDG